MRTPTAFIYSVELVTIKTFTLIEILQSLLQPAQLAIDPNEVSEIIKVDLATVTITESIALHSSPDHTNTSTITLSESIQKDPIGAGVAPIYVYGAWVPSPLSSPKRVFCVSSSSTLA
jgi:hypothetical protein